MMHTPVVVRGAPKKPFRKLPQFAHCLATACSIAVFVCIHSGFQKYEFQNVPIHRTVAVFCHSANPSCPNWTQKHMAMQSSRTTRVVQKKKSSSPSFTTNMGPYPHGVVVESTHHCFIYVYPWISRDLDVHII